MSSPHTDSPLWVGDIFVGGIGFQIHANFQRAQVEKQAEGKLQSQSQSQTPMYMQNDCRINGSKLCPYHQKIEDEKQNGNPGPSNAQRAPIIPASGRYTKAEKKWMKNRFRNERKFLWQCDLDIRKPGDRLKGLWIIQQFMRNAREREQRHFRGPNGHHNGIDRD